MTPVFADKVFITGLRATAVIGIYDWERQIRQNLRLDLEMETDVRRAAASEDISDALDYEKISNRVKDFIENSEFLLIETLAEQLAALLMDEFHIPWLRLTVHKPGAVEFSDDVGVVIERRGS